MFSGNTIAATHRFIRPHGEEISHERRESWSEAALGDEAKLEFGQTHGVVTALPVPARDVQQVRLEAERYE